MTISERTEVTAQKIESLRNAKGMEAKRTELADITDEDLRLHEPKDSEKRAESWWHAW